MNIGKLSPAAFELALEKKLRELLESVSWLEGLKIARNPAEKDRAFDLLADFKLSRGPKVELWIDCHRDPRPAQFPYVSIQKDFEKQQVKQVRAGVFAAPFITSRMADVCEEHGWGWFDLAGNCRISIPEILHLERKGNLPIHKRPESSVNLSTPEAARVMRALLNIENTGIHWTQRELQEGCVPKVSLGLVNKVVTHLRSEALIDEVPRRGFRVVDPQKLLSTWKEVYRFDQHRRVSYFSLMQGSKLRDALTKLDAESDGRVAYAAFSAADIQAPHVRQPKTWLYIDETQIPQFEMLVEAKEVDSGDNLAVLIPKDAGVFYATEKVVGDERRICCTNLIQSYVDLWHCGGRGGEAAGALMEQRIMPGWREKAEKV